MKKIIIGFGKTAKKILPKKEPDLSKVKKICIFKVGAIGDVLMTTPLVRWLCSRFPKAQIDYWTGKWSSPVIENNHHLDHVKAFDEKIIFRKKLFALQKLAKKIRKEKYDLMFMLDFSYLANIFAKVICRMPVIIGFDRNGEGFLLTKTAKYGKRRYDVEAYLDLARLVKAKPSDNSNMEMFFKPEEDKFAREFFKKHKLNPEKTIAIAPGGAKNPGMDLDFKRWPAVRFAKVAKALEKKGYQILLIGGPGDREASDIVKVVVKCTDATGKFSLRKSSALLRYCKQLVCNDSGPMHIAAAVGTPVTAVFGPTDPKKLAPRGRKHKILWKHPDNKPCYVDGELLNCPDNHKCIKHITVNDVLKAIK